MVSFKKMFVDVYSNELSKYGFVRAKGKYPYIVRFVSEDIINIITYKNSNHSNQGAKSFFVLCDIATVYRPKISLDKSPEANAWWMHNSESIIARMGHSREQYSYTYRCFDEDDMYKTIIESLDDMKNYILPLFDSVKTLSSCIDYYDEFGGFMSIIVDSNFGTNANYNEGHLYIIANKKSFNALLRNATTNSSFRILHSALTSDPFAINYYLSRSNYGIQKRQ